jgi:dTDP-4-dehydrorhamnose reductase
MSACILVTGAQGQVGHALMGQAPEHLQVTGLGSAELDIRDPLAVEQCIARLQPRLIINAAAYTAVDKAESDAAQAYAVNAEGVANLARSAARHGAGVLHISTDYVFAGDSPQPYREDAPTAPINVYGASKLAGEQLLRELCPQSLILRTSWVFGSHGNNFVKTMLRLARERDELSAVDDQLGCPTPASSIAGLLWNITTKQLYENTIPWEVYNFCGSPPCTKHELAERILLGLNELHPRTHQPVLEKKKSAYFKSAALRPTQSILSNEKIKEMLKIKQPDWKNELKSTIYELIGKP